MYKFKHQLCFEQGLLPFSGGNIKAICVDFWKIYAVIQEFYATAGRAKYQLWFLLPFSAKSRRKPPIRVSTDVCFISRNTIFISPEVFLISIKAIFISPEVFYLLRRHFHLPIGVFTILPLNPPHDRKWEWREEISMDWLNDNRNRKSVLDPDNTQSDFDDSQRASDFCEMQIFFA